MARKRLTLRQLIERQDNRRGFGLARDVAAGQARETPLSAQRRRRRRQGQMRYYRKSGSWRA